MSPNATAVKGRDRAEVGLMAEQRMEIRETSPFDFEQRLSIDRHELRVAMRALGFEFSKSKILEFMENLDPDNSGTIEWTVFLEFSDKMVKHE
jgi:Ca2+-binding EF-hand superfamily protein